VQWGYIVASGVVVLATYAALIETWRRIVGEWHATMRFSDAARIWFVSNLGKYVPGKVWQILAMGKLAERVNVPPAAAAGSSIVSTVVNIAMGFAIALLAGFRALDTMSHGHARIGVLLIIVVLGGVFSLPFLMPQIAAVARRLTGRAIDLGTLPPRAVIIAIAGNAIAWVMYGWSFQLLVHGVVGEARGGLSDYVAAYALSYVIGYLVFFIPGGIGTREAVQTLALQTLGLAGYKEALVIAAVSRLWLTVLEVLPGLFYLARGTRLRPQAPPSTPLDGSTR